MTVIMYPPPDRVLYPTLGPALCAWIEANLCHGPGDLLGKPLKLNAEWRGWIYRMYEVEPAKIEVAKLHTIVRSKNPNAGRRRFQRCALSLRKGSSKTELAAIIAAAELHHEAPVRCDGFDAAGSPSGRAVTDPYIPMISYTEEQTEELAYGALRRILQECAIANDFDIGLERIMRLSGDGKAEAVSASPNARDGARTTFQHADEALALDTLLPTPDGWTTMGDVQPGDRLIGRDGQPCRVVGKSPVHQSRNCYRVTFEDGSSVVTDGGHLWYARRRGGCGHGQGCRCSIRQGWAVRSTESMVGDVIHQSGKRSAFTYHIPVGGSIQTPTVELPVDPYVLGLWLGDGDARNAMIAAGFVDTAEIAAHVRECGYMVTEGVQGMAARLYVTTPDSRRGRFGDSVVGRLRRLGLLGDKHIPELYLRASTEQRLALLQGLMDSDGHISKRGDCTFVNTNGPLVQGVLELLRSLCFTPTVKWREDGRRASYRRLAKVAFQADAQMPVFRLERKRSRLRAIRDVRHASLAIAAIERVDSVPVQCVAVDAPDSLFRAGEGMLVTHNTHRFTLDSLKRTWTVMRANMLKRPISDAWALETTTAPEPGAGSVAEETMRYVESVAATSRDAGLFFYHRQASEKYNIENEDELREAIIEASGPHIAAWSNIDGIVASFQEPDADHSYLDRVWLNRPVQATGRAFDIGRWRELSKDFTAPPGSAITLGFDGSRYEDATSLIATHIQSGHQWPIGIWEKPWNQPDWEVPVDEVDAAVHDAFARWRVCRMYCDPPKWESWIAGWAGEFTKERVVEWWTNRRKPMAYAIRSYIAAITAGELTHNGDRKFDAHIANSRKQETHLVDDEEKPLWILRKERPDSPLKIDAAVAGVISWEARNDAVAAGEGVEQSYQLMMIG